MSPIRPLRRVVPLALIALSLAACGNKGPLVRPPAKPDATTPAPTPAAPAPPPASAASGH